MTDDIERDMKKLMGELDDDLGFSTMGESTQNKRKFGFSSKGKVLLLSLLVIVVLIVVISMWPRGNNDISKTNIRSDRSAEVKLNQMEKRLIALNGTDNRIALLESREKALQKRAEELDNYIKSLIEREDMLNQKVGTLIQKVEALEQSEKKPAAVSVSKISKPVVQKPPKNQPAAKRYHTVRQGQNLYRISLQYGISVDELCRLNNMTQKDPIRPGQKLIVGPGTTD